MSNSPVKRMRVFAIESPSALDVLADRTEAQTLRAVCKLLGHDFASTLVRSAAEFTTALNRAYGVAETRPIWRVRGRSIVIMIVGVVATIVAATSMLVGPELLRRVSTFFGLRGGFDRLWGALRWPLAFGALTSMAAFTYYFLPNVQHRRRFIMPGSIVAVLGWIMASMGFKLYVAHFASYARTYGALGTVVVLLVWLYIGGLTLIVGGQINAILDRLHRRSVHTATRTDGSVMRAPRLV